MYATDLHRLKLIHNLSWNNLPVDCQPNTKDNVKYPFAYEVRIHFLISQHSQIQYEPNNERGSSMNIMNIEYICHTNCFRKRIKKISNTAEKNYTAEWREHLSLSVERAIAHKRKHEHEHEHKHSHWHNHNRVKCYFIYIRTTA